MVGQDHEVVGPRRVLGGASEAAQRPIDAVERLEALRPLRAAVMGDLVVVGVRDVDRGRASEHLLDHQAGDERPEHDVRHRAQRRVGKAARVEAWLDPARRARRAWKISLATSAMPSTIAWTKPYGLRKKLK